MLQLNVPLGDSRGVATVLAGGVCSAARARRSSILKPLSWRRLPYGVSWLPGAGPNGWVVKCRSSCHFRHYLQSARDTARRETAVSSAAARGELCDMLCYVMLCYVICWVYFYLGHGHGPMGEQ